jgi:SsrA-binding protein
MSDNTIATNRQAWHDFFIHDKFEAGIVLKGNEVKSLRDGRSTLKDSFVRILNGEAILFNLHIPPYRHDQNVGLYDPIRTRKLLLNRSEIEKLAGQSQIKGFTIVALSIYFKHGRVKVQIALAQGKKQFDKRESIKKKDQEREIQQVMRKRQKSN